MDPQTQPACMCNGPGITHKAYTQICTKKLLEKTYLQKANQSSEKSWFESSKCTYILMAEKRLLCTNLQLQEMTLRQSLVSGKNIVISYFCVQKLPVVCKKSSINIYLKMKIISVPMMTASFLLLLKRDSKMSRYRPPKKTNKSNPIHLHYNRSKIFSIV